jgi:DNA-binding PadR family transcriptional regulator
MSLKHGLLGLINYEGSTTGYELDKFFKNSLSNFWHAKTSQIYRELSAMENMGWLTSERVFQEEKPNKRVYSITPLGKAELLKWLSSPDIGSEGGVKSAFLMRIFFAGDVGKGQTLKMLREYREQCAALSLGIDEAQNAIAEDEALGTNPKHIKYWKLTALHGEIYYRAGMEWADKAIALLEDEEE